MQSRVRPSRHRAQACGLSLVLQSFRIFPGRADYPARGCLAPACAEQSEQRTTPKPAAARRAARRGLRLCLAVFLSATLWSVSVHADNWPAWRGVNGLGTTREKNLPLQWSATEN